MVDEEERYRNYLRFLIEVYEATEGSEIPYVNMWKIGEKIGTGGQSSVQTHNIVNWLIGEGLIRWQYVGGEIGLTHRGIKEVENVRRHPERPTKYFSTQNINYAINVGAMYNSSIQQGTSNSNQTIIVNSQQQQEITKVIEEIKEILNQQRKSITEEKLDEIERQIEHIEVELKSKKPRWEQLKGYLTSIKNFAEGTVIAASITQKIMMIPGILGS